MTMFQKAFRILKRSIFSNFVHPLAFLALFVLPFFIFLMYEKRSLKTNIPYPKQLPATMKMIEDFGSVKQYHPFCGPFSLKRDNTATPNTVTNSCIVSPVDEDTCGDIKDRFYSYSADFSCPGTELCKLDNRHSFDRNNLDSLIFSCDLFHCHQESSLSIGFINATNGFLTWSNPWLSDNIKLILKNLAIRTLKAGYPFLFLECNSKIPTKTIRQLLVLPYITKSYEPQVKNPANSFVNINMMLIDSVSRPHFYRSLPKTVKYLTDLQASSRQHVLDFELLHAVKSRTFESLQALFTGKLLEIGSEFEGVAIPPQAVEFHKLLKMFKERDYETLYQEDLCWEHDWGLIRDTGVYKENPQRNERFSALNKALKNSLIDNTGMTHSSCNVFHRYDIIDHFNFPSKICYGKHLQHDFFLDYLDDALNRTRKPLFTFTLMNVGHEGTAQRIRTFDQSLKRFLGNMDDHGNTVHILFSDHGNTYGDFSASSVGRFEMFHPFLFMVIPESITMRIGKVGMRNLQTNTKRLITLVDLHHTIVSLLGMLHDNNADNSLQSKTGIRHLTNNFTNAGLLGNISPKRGCDDLKLLHGTLCFCEGWKSSLRVSSVHFLLAEHALAWLNRVISGPQLLTRLQVASDIQHKHCEQLQGYAIRNVWQKRVKGKLLLGIDITTQYSAIFSVVLSLSLERQHSFDIRVDSFERLTRYGNFKACAYPAVELNLCLCSITKPTEIIQRIPKTALGSVFHATTISRKIHHPCFYILSRTYKAGVVFEASNSCSNVSYTVDLYFELVNMKLSQDAVKATVAPASVEYLVAAIMIEAGFEWSWKYSVDLTWESV